MQTVDLPDIDFPDFPISVDDPNIIFSVRDDDVIIYWIDEKQEAVIPIDVWESFVKYDIQLCAAKEKYETLQKAYAIPK